MTWCQNQDFSSPVYFPICGNIKDTSWDTKIDSFVIIEKWFGIHWALVAQLSKKYRGNIRELSGTARLALIGAYHMKWKVNRTNYIWSTRGMAEHKFLFVVQSILPLPKSRVSIMSLESLLKIIGHWWFNDQFFKSAKSEITISTSLG